MEEPSVVNALTAKLDSLVAALNNSNRGRPAGGSAQRTRNTSPGSRSALGRPDPKFEGCWNCGAKGHSRRQCEKFKKLLADNNGKIPNGYQGAYEKFKAAAQKKKVAAVPVVDDFDAEDLEHSETLPL